MSRREQVTLICRLQGYSKICYCNEYVDCNLSLLCHPEPSKSANSCCCFFVTFRWLWAYSILNIFVGDVLEIDFCALTFLFSSNTLISGECIQVVNDVFSAFDGFCQKFVLILADEIYMKTAIRYGGYHVVVFAQITGLLHQQKHSLLLWSTLLRVPQYWSTSCSSHKLKTWIFCWNLVIGSEDNSWYKWICFWNGNE